MGQGVIYTFIFFSCPLQFALPLGDTKEEKYFAVHSDQNWWFLMILTPVLVPSPLPKILIGSRQNEIAIYWR